MNMYNNTHPCPCPCPCHRISREATGRARRSDDRPDAGVSTDTRVQILKPLICDRLSVLPVASCTGAYRYAVSWKIKLTKGLPCVCIWLTALILAAINKFVLSTASSGAILYNTLSIGSVMPRVRVRAFTPPPRGAKPALALAAHRRRHHKRSRVVRQQGTAVDASVPVASAPTQLVHRHIIRAPSRSFTP